MRMWKSELRQETELMALCLHNQVKMKKGVLQCFGHVEQMSDARLTKQVYVSSVNGRLRPSLADQVSKLFPFQSELNRCMFKLNNYKLLFLFTNLTQRPSSYNPGFFKRGAERHVCRPSRWEG